MLWLTRFSVKNPVAVLIISLLVVLGGVYSFLVINMESEPQAKLGMLTISTAYPNASSEDVVNDITKPLETAVDAVSGVKEYISASEENHSLITVSLEESADADKVQRDVEKSIANVRLPSGAGRPKIALQMVGSEPLYFLAISNQGQSRTNEAFYQLVEDRFVDRLEKLDGVSSVQVIGMQKKVVRIKPKQEMLLHYGLTASDVKQAVAAQHVASSAGSVNADGTEMIVRLENEYTDLEQIKHTRLRLTGTGTMAAGSIELGDVAEVGWDTSIMSVSRLNGKPAVALQIAKTPEGNIVKISGAIRAQLDEFRKQYPDLRFEIVSDRSDYVKSSIGGMAREGGMGIVMAAIAIYLFLRHVKSTLIVLVSIPLCVLISLTFLQYMGVSINLMSLFGMTVAIGRVVDDSIVVIENIFRHVRTRPGEKATVLVAVKEVAGAITSSTLTTVAVFLPIAFVSGIMGDFFKPFALAVVCSLLGSLLVAVTVIPLLASATMLGEQEPERREGRLLAAYEKLLGWAFAHKGKVAAITLAMFLASAGLAASLPTGFMPELNMKLLYVKVSMPAGTALEVTDAKLKEIEAAVLRQKEVVYVQSRIGAPLDEAKKTTLGNLTIKLRDDAEDDAVLNRVRTAVDPLVPVGAQISYSKPAAGGQGGYQIEINADDSGALKEAATVIKAAMKQNPLLANIKDNLSEQIEQLSIKVDRERASELGLSPGQIADEVETAIGNNKQKQIVVNGKEYDLIVGTGEATGIAQLEQMWVHSPLGQQVPLSELASLKKEVVPGQVLRKDGKPYVQITADILSEDKGGVSQEQTKALQQLKLPAGVTISAEGLQADMQKGFIEMFAAMGAAVLLVFLVMVITFGNLSAPLAILLSLPLASIGGLLGLWLSNGVMDMTVLIGFLMLIGIVVTNAIVLIDRVQQLLGAGESIRAALVEAGKTRMRPIMMTAIATIASLLPLALGFSEGSLLSKGLSTVVIGGLLTSTLLTLVVVPVGYDSLYRFINRKRSRRKNNAAQLEGGVANR
ncbi:efflux RND transporter permease subunit [Brevibacillus fluminis]|uniref:efflux RND transporter permease subunit n=1 Tax=Brevibacillus fluminis TaxID=511487 RepID=UPI003F8AD29C